MKLLTILSILILCTSASAELIHQVDQSKCNGCGLCVGVCPHGAATMDGNVAIIDPDKCMLSNGCAGACYYHCHNLPAGGDAIYKTNYTGIEDGESVSLISLSPLPCSSSLNIVGVTEGSEFRILNILGREVVTDTSITNEISIDVSNLSQGIYVLLIDESFSSTIQVIR